MSFLSQETRKAHTRPGLTCSLSYKVHINDMPSQKPIERDYYLPILDTIRSFGGSASLDEIRFSVRPFLRTDESYLDEPAGPKTSETRFEKDLNWGGKRLGDAGLIRKARTHWELTDEGRHNFFTAKTLTLLCELAGGRAKKKANKKGR
jgi:Mrr N-terminal domain